MSRGPFRPACSPASTNGHPQRHGERDADAHHHGDARREVRIHGERDAREHVRPPLLFLAVDEQYEPDAARNQRDEKPRRVEVHRVDNTPVHLTRRELLEMTALLVVAPPADEVERRSADAIRAYSAEGHHRTATAVDRASADALHARARATGAATSLEPFDLSRVDPAAAFVQIQGQRLDGLPMFDGAFNGAGGVTGAIGPAVGAVTMGGKPGLCPVNAGWFSEPFGPPVLQVSSEALAAIEHASASGVEVRVVAHATRRRAQAFNVVADIRGTDPTLPPVCVMTPRSGWHANASERGGGLACWLETMRAVVAARPRRTVRFIASSGHELGHLGLHDYLHRNPALAHDAYAWVHFGANIGTSTGDVGMTPSDDRLRDAAVRAFAPHGLEKIRQSPAAQVGGEAATIQEQNGRFISSIGANAWFHNSRDLWPDAVDIQAVARFARATTDLTLQLANS